MKKHNLLYLASLILALFLFTIPLSAQFSGNIDVSFTPQQEEMSIGDPVNILLEIKHPADYTVVIPPLPQVWGDFEVRAQAEPEITDHGDGVKTTSQLVEVTLFNVGQFQTPGWSISLKDSGGQVIERAVPHASLTVIPTLTDEAPELKDIKPQAELPLAPLWPWIVLGVFISLFLVLLAYWLYKRLKYKFSKTAQLEQAEPAPYVDPRPAHVIALEELTRIERLDLPGQGRFKEYYTLVTDCLRHYLERAYAVPAMDCTTAEIKAGLRTTAIQAEQSREFINLFSQSDFVKFARLIPQIDDARCLIPAARTLIEQTKPALPLAEAAVETEATA